ncbi:hypothetical protein [Azospirillum formosense]|uniref:hypothetical protein n=1 Tax=Azospirillum formosense TaxID=861533 RepID=UPI00338D4F7D
MKKLGNLQRRVPNWTAAWGSGFIERAQAGRDDNPIDPTAAARSRDAMASEDPKLAAWYAAHRPLAFGVPGVSSWEVARAGATDAKALRDRAARPHGLAVLADTVDRTFPAGDADLLVHAIRARVERMTAAIPPEHAGTPTQSRRERRDGRVRCRCACGCSNGQSPRRYAASIVHSMSWRQDMGHGRGNRRGDDRRGDDRRDDGRAGECSSDDRSARSTEGGATGTVEATMAAARRIAAHAVGATATGTNGAILRAAAERIAAMGEIVGEEAEGVESRTATAFIWKASSKAIRASAKVAATRRLI